MNEKIATREASGQVLVEISQSRCNELQETIQYDYCEDGKEGNKGKLLGLHTLGMGSPDLFEKKEIPGYNRDEAQWQSVYQHLPKFDSRDIACDYHTGIEWPSEFPDMSEPIVDAGFRIRIDTLQIIEIIQQGCREKGTARHWKQSDYRRNDSQRSPWRKGAPDARDQLLDHRGFTHLHGQQDDR